MLANTTSIGVRYNFAIPLTAQKYCVFKISYRQSGRWKHSNNVGFFLFFFFSFFLFWPRRHFLHFFVWSNLRQDPAMQLYE